eukprot:13486040-Ditylum_brightwellii.AAC.1
MEVIENTKETSNEETAASGVSAVSANVGDEVSKKDDKEIETPAATTPASEAKPTGSGDDLHHEQGRNINEGATSYRMPMKENNGDGAVVTLLTPHGTEHERDGNIGAASTKADLALHVKQKSSKVSGEAKSITVREETKHNETSNQFSVVTIRVD